MEKKIKWAIGVLFGTFILLGISVWKPGQLDSEMTQGDWDKKINSYIPLFNNGKEMWMRLISAQDI